MKQGSFVALAALGIGMLAAAATARAADLELYHADFHARLGMRLHAQVGQVAPDVSMKAVLTGGKGPAKTVFEKSGKLDAQETVTLDLRELPAGDHTLTVSLSDGRTASRTWTKPYDGVPAVGIDENYAICVDGKPFFPVMCKGVSDEKDVEKWLPYVNTMKHVGFSEKLYPPQGFKAWLDLAQKYGLKAVGPGRGLYWPNGGGIYKSKTQRDRRTIPEKQEPYIKIAREHPAFLMYEWKDEPELDNADNCIFPEEVRRWVDQCHDLDKQHPVFCTFAGYGFARPEDNWMHQHVRSFTYLHGRLPVGKRLFTDVFSTDYYPIENARDKYGVSIEGMCRAMDNIRKYNANLVPLIACVETCDIQKADTPAPTPEEITVMCWANIIHGAKGISWFHYFKPTPPENLKAMARFKDQVTRLTPAVLGPDYEGTISKREHKGGRVDIKVTQSGGDVTIFAANLKREAETVTLTLDADAKSVEVVDEQRTIRVQDRAFTDDFAPLAVHIYRLKK